MKRLILPLLCLFVLASSSFAWMTLPVVGGSGGSCPPWYADAGVIFSWDGEHDDGHNFGCEADGTVQEADTDDAVTTTFDSQVVVQLDNAGTPTTPERLLWNQAYADGSEAAQTICLKVYSTATPTNAIPTWQAGDGNNDLITNRVNNGPNIKPTFDSQSSAAVTVYDTTRNNDVWENHVFTWNNVGAATACSALVEPYSTHDGAWTDGAAIDDTTTPFTQFIIGDYYGVLTDAGEYVYISQVAIVTGYKFDCATLTGW